MRKLDWNFERYRTRDRLLECDDFILPIPSNDTEVFQIYPLKDTDLIFPKETNINQNNQ